VGCVSGAYRVGDIIDVPFANGPERAEVVSVEWFPNDGASIYVGLLPVKAATALDDEVDDAG
jgi:hypothetical protein